MKLLKTSIALLFLSFCVACATDPSQIPPKPGEEDTSATQAPQTADGPSRKLSAPESPGASGTVSPIAVKAAQCTADPKIGGC